MAARVVVVTGASRGIGRGVAARFRADGRAGTVEDIAETVVFLASPGARHLTGQVLHVNGGAFTTR